METRNEKLQAIFDSHTNGQLTQMTEQIDEYKNMYDIFDDLRNWMHENSIGITTANGILVDIVIKYHRIKYR